MRNRKIQRWLKQNQKERGVSLRDSAGVLDPTAFEAIKNIVAAEKKELLQRYFESVYHCQPLSREDETELQNILDEVNEQQRGGNIGPQ